ncbi:glutaredoxin 3 [Paracoccus sp. Z118]|uniref:glutaredoxin 3 n=1 Tax=Paracoccus sp. Z118 TaxID=2851017 RepID=UPI001C2BE82D|nr:glutaredoxin 3 [Paracoccus sp. Z118]MBV0891829.1 glutaredoxin 3 [Paracoccus sp. Z118]
MPKVEMYMTRTCPYCHAARTLLDRKGVSYETIDVGANPDRRAEMTQRANGRRTVPQIFIDGKPMGGSDEIHALDRQGKLDALLGL